MEYKSTDKVSLAIIGSGAIAEESYLPAAEKASNVVVSYLVDLDIDRAKELANRFEIPNYTNDYREIFGKVQAAVVATPPSSHSKISVDCLNNGLHVLCEKPLASSIAEARDMVEASKKNHVYLAVGMVRRLNWSAGLLKNLVQKGFIGKISHFDAEEGWEFCWPLRTGHIFQSKNSGVIADTGAHLFDVVLWILGSQEAEVIECRDDNWGGSEANAAVRLAVDTLSGAVSGDVQISFTRKLRNTLRIYGERGFFEAETVGANEILFYLDDENTQPLIIKPQQNIAREKNREFVAQLANFADALLGKSNNYVPAEQVLATMKLIDSCYSKREPMAQQWDKLHLEEYFGGKRFG